MRVALVALLVGCGSSPASSTTPTPPDRADHQAALSVETRYFDHQVTHVMKGSGFDLAKLPMTSWFGLPWSGRGSIDLQVKVPLVNGAEDWTLADGTLEVSCERCQVGDDVAKLPIGGSGTAAGNFAGEGITFGHLGFSSIAAQVKLTGGTAELTAWKLESKDIMVEVSGRVALMPVLDESHVEVCVRFKGTPELAKRDARTAALVELTGAATGGDGMFNIRLSGPLANPRRLAQVCDGSQPITDATPPAEAVPGGPFADLQDAIDRGITKIDDTTYGVSLALVDLVVADPIGFVKGARIVPAMKDGQSEGFKLYAIRPTSAFSKLGLKNGDTLVSIGGKELSSAEDVLEISSKLGDLKAGSSVTLELTRRGKPVTITYLFR